MARFIRLACAVALAFGVLMAGVGRAYATSGAHFFSAVAGITSTGALTVVTDEAGVGQQTVDYLLTANGAYTYACINNGGHNPSAANKQAFTETVQQAQSFNPTNGRVHGSFTSGSPTPGGFACPRGQTLTLACVSYRSIVVQDLTNGVSTADSAKTAIPDVSAIFVSPPIAQQVGC